MCDDKKKIYKKKIRERGRMEFAPAGAKGEDTAVNKESNCQAEKDVFLPRCLT